MIKYKSLYLTALTTVIVASQVTPMYAETIAENIDTGARTDTTSIGPSITASGAGEVTKGDVTTGTGSVGPTITSEPTPTTQATPTTQVTPTTPTTPTPTPMFDYVSQGNGTVTITGYNSSSNIVSIPIAINGSTVTSIGPGAFKGKGITSLTLPPSLQSIGNEAFANNSITNVEIPFSVTSIGSSAFANNSLTSLSLPDKLTNLGENAFSNNSLVNVQLPSNLTSIPNGAFQKNKLVTIALSENLSVIGDRAFADNSMVAVSLPKGMISVGAEAFRNNKITTLYIPSTVASASNDAFLGNPLDNVTIPKRLKNVLMGVTNTNSMYNLYLYEDGKDPGSVTAIPESEKKKQDNEVKLSNLTQQQIINLGLVSGSLAITKPTFTMNSFGNIKIIDKPIKIALSLSSDIIVSDLRGTLEGWHLTVTATPLTEVVPKAGTAPKGGWFKLPAGTLAIAQPESVYEVDEKGNAKSTTELTLPSSTFTGGYAVVDNGPVTVLSAPVDKGNGIWGLRFPKDALVLTVSPKTARVDKENYPNSPTPYTTTITWNLVSGPGTSVSPVTNTSTNTSNVTNSVTTQK